MSSDLVKRYLDHVSKMQTTVPTAHQFVLARNVSFSFAHFNVSYPGFDLRADGNDLSLQEKNDRLINTFELLSQRSVGPITDSQHHCHAVETKRLINCGMQALVEYFPDKTFYQLGSNYRARPERVIGFYDDNTNVFQICLLDLHHRVYARAR